MCVEEIQGIFLSFLEKFLCYKSYIQEIYKYIIYLLYIKILIFSIAFILYNCLQAIMSLSFSKKQDVHVANWGL